MKILILGASGMAGHMIATYLTEKGHEVETLSATKKFNAKTTLLDVSSPSALETYLKGHSFDLVINCIGLLIQACETHLAKAILINAYLPHFLETYYANSPTKIIQLSTDCVFSGENPPYLENHSYDGLLFYDRTKALGELKNNKDLTFRMSIIGPDLTSSGIGLFNWFMMAQGTIYGYQNVYWNGITTLELAKAIEAAIHQNLTGLYHLVPKDAISKYDLLLLFKEIFAQDELTILPKDVVPIYKVLTNTRTDFNFKVQSYRPMLIELRSWILAHPERYPHYLKKGAR